MVVVCDGLRRRKGVEVQKTSAKNTWEIRTRVTFLVQKTLLCLFKKRKKISTN